MEIELSFVHQESILNSSDRNDDHECAQKLNQLDDNNSPNDPEKRQFDYNKNQIFTTNTKNTDKIMTEMNVKFEDNILNQLIDDQKTQNNIQLALNTSYNVKSQTGIIND